MALKGGSALKG